MKRRASLLSLLAGLAVITVAQLAAPLGSPPLYDGVIVLDPYRYLAPGPGQVGAPTSFHASPGVEGTTSPQFVAATTESPPQAQLIAPPGAFVVPPGTTTLAVSIEPVPASQPPATGPIAGNVYRVAVADPSGTELVISQATPPTLALRAPGAIPAATINQFADGAWKELATQESGQPGIFLANVTTLGDFALIAAPTAGPFGLDPTLLAVAAVAAAISVVVLGYLTLNGRRRASAVPQVPPTRDRRRSKSGRSGPRRGGSQ